MAARGSRFAHSFRRRFAKRTWKSPTGHQTNWASFISRAAPDGPSPTADRAQVLGFVLSFCHQNRLAVIARAGCRGASIGFVRIADDAPRHMQMQSLLPKFAM